MRKIKNALISVSDKKNLKKILSTIKKYKIKIISSGGTYKEIKRLGFKCTEISEFTGFPEILSGRVKTLHPKIHSGILSRRIKPDIKQLRKYKFEEIDLVIINFYPFEDILSKTNKKNKIIENIDIGGPSLVRAAAKNYKNVTIVSSTDQYSKLIYELNKFKGATSYNFRRDLSKAAFLETSYYDSLIFDYLNKSSNEVFAKKKTLFGKKIEVLRYGENPHQKAAIYTSNSVDSLHQLSGKKLSYNNYNDLFSAVKISNSLPKNTGTVIVKHNNPCGVSINKSKLKSYQMAYNSDPISAFGGIVSCNFKIDRELAKRLSKKFIEII